MRCLPVAYREMSKCPSNRELRIGAFSSSWLCLPSQYPRAQIWEVVWCADVSKAGVSMQGDDFALQLLFSQVKATSCFPPVVLKGIYRCWEFLSFCPRGHFCKWMGRVVSKSGTFLNCSLRVGTTPLVVPGFSRQMQRNTCERLVL